MDTKRLDEVLQDLIPWVVAPMWACGPLPNWGSPICLGVLPHHGEVVVKAIGMEYRLGMIQEGVCPRTWLSRMDAEECVYDSATPLVFEVDVSENNRLRTARLVCRRPVFGPQDKLVMAVYSLSERTKHSGWYSDSKLLYRNNYLTKPSGELNYVAWAGGKYLSTKSLLDLAKPPMIFGM